MSLRSKSLPFYFSLVFAVNLEKNFPTTARLVPLGDESKGGQFKAAKHLKDWSKEERWKGVISCQENIKWLFPLSELPGVHVLHPVEETGEGGDFGEMELVGDLGDAQRGLTQ